MYSNKYQSILWTILLACLPLMSMAQEKKKETPAANKAPKTFEAFCDKNTKTTEGVFPVYRKAANVYMEIGEELLGKEILASGIIVKGPWMGTASTITDLISFSKGHDHNLSISKMICTDRAEGELAQAVQNSSMQSVMYNYPIVAYGKDKKGYIIDITKDVNATGKLFAFPNLQWVNRPVADRSGLDSIYNIKDGILFRSLHTQTDYMPALVMGGAGYDKHNTVLIDWALQVLPERKVAPRKADKRVGITSITFNDYDLDPAGAKTLKFIRRWNLQPKAEDMARYKAGELVTPENPIKVYIDTTYNANMRRGAIRSVEEWNKCFEKAGFKQALVVCEGMPESMFAYHQIVLSYALMLPRAQTVSDPRTGEIICAVGSISDNELYKAEVNVQLTFGGSRPQVFSTDRQAIREELCRFQTSQQLGFILGLEPNMAGSMAFTVDQLRNAQWVHEHGISASVTDGVAFDYLAQPEDNIPLRDLFSKASVYDEWAIEWAYRLYPDATREQEQAALNKVAARANNNPSLRFFPMARKSYMNNKFDLSADKMKAADLAVLNLQRTLPKLEGLVNQHDLEDYWYKYWEYAPLIYASYGTYTLQALDYIGSIWQEPIIAGYNEKTYHIAPKAMQERALRYVIDHAFCELPKWMHNDTLRYIAGYTGAEPMRLLATNAAMRLANPETMANMLLSQIHFGKEAFTLDDMDAILDEKVFLGFSAQKAVPAHLVSVQYTLIKQYAECFSKARDNKKADDVALYIGARMQKVVKQIERLSRTHADAATRAHYRSLLVYINRKMVPTAETAIPAKK